MIRKPKGPMADKAMALLKKQEQGINMGESRTHLGRFAKSFAQVQQKARNAEKAASVPPSQKHKTYDDIERKSKRLSQTRWTPDAARSRNFQLEPS